MPKKKKKSLFSSKSSNRYLLKLVAILCLVIIVVVAIVLFVNWKHTNTSKLSSTSNSKPNTSISTDHINDTPAPSADNNSSESAKSFGTSNTKSGSSGSGSNSSSFSDQIVSANVSNGNLHVGTAVYGTTSGNCTLTASQSSQATLTLGSSIVKQDVNYYDCGAFNIPTSTFPSSGVWELTLTVSVNDTNASNSTTVEIN